MIDIPEELEIEFIEKLNYQPDDNDDEMTQEEYEDYINNLVIYIREISENIR